MKIQIKQTFNFSNNAKAQVEPEFSWDFLELKVNPFYDLLSVGKVFKGIPRNGTLLHI